VTLPPGFAPLKKVNTGQVTRNKKMDEKKGKKGRACFQFGPRRWGNVPLFRESGWKWRDIIMGDRRKKRREKECGQLGIVSISFNRVGRRSSIPFRKMKRKGKKKGGGGGGGKCIRSLLRDAASLLLFGKAICFSVRNNK